MHGVETKAPIPYRYWIRVCFSPCGSCPTMPVHLSDFWRVLGQDFCMLQRLETHIFPYHEKELVRTRLEVTNEVRQTFSKSLHTPPQTKGTCPRNVGDNCNISIILRTHALVPLNIEIWPGVFLSNLCLLQSLGVFQEVQFRCFDVLQSLLRRGHLSGDKELCQGQNRGHRRCLGMRCLQWGLVVFLVGPIFSQERAEQS